MKDCESCGQHFSPVKGRGFNNRIMCYDCLPLNSGDRLLSYRNKHMKSQYGLTLFQYRELYKQQGGSCSICNAPIDFDGSDLKKGDHRLPTQPCIDHCHKSGKVRGILCFHCNTALGHVKDDVSLLHRMIQYLNEHNTPLDNKQTTKETYAICKTLHLSLLCQLPRCKETSG